jgi:lipopolysaccharide/colanic/teichoic acid biosynthesis glycosyltransferase
LVIHFFDLLMMYPVLKRLFDIVFSIVGLVLVSPLILLVALLMKLTDSGPVFYGQVRIGRYGIPFKIWKFRSMVVGAEKMGALVTQQEDPRMTPLGRRLRKTKIDELPQLWNVLKGEMSFVGPRPQVPRYIERLSSSQREMLQHRPGITDMASLKFRNEQELLSGAKDVDDFYIRFCLPRKIALNLQYARQASLLYDVWIIAQTLCPYWLGVLALYAIILVASLWISFELRYDFGSSSQYQSDFWTCLPWIVLPQLFLLLWRKQCRGLVSYFSFVELLQTGLALGLALLIHLGISYSSQGALVPPSGVIATDLVVSLWGITWARLALQFMREDQAAKLKGAKMGTSRIAIIGAGDLGTRLALDLITRDVPANVVAFFDDDPRTWNLRPYDIPVVGMPECLLNAEWIGKVDEIIVALPEASSGRVKEVEDLLAKTAIKVAVATAWPAVQTVQA